MSTSNSEGTVGNADKWTATFVDANGDAVETDGAVTWVITGPDAATVTMAAVSAVSTGTFVYTHTPSAAQPYTIKASAAVSGDAQATPAITRKVRE